MDLLTTLARRQESVSTHSSLILSETIAVVSMIKKWQKETKTLSRSHLKTIVYVSNKMKSNWETVKMVDDSSEIADEMRVQVKILDDIAREALARLSEMSSEMDGVADESSAVEMAYSMMSKAMNTTQLLYGEEIRALQREADAEGLEMYLRDGSVENIVKGIKSLPKEKAAAILKGLK